jgi:predicted transcriptional regulator of viral defense system
LIVMNNYQHIATTRGASVTGGPFRTRDLEALGYSRTAIGRLVKRGQLIRLGRGVYVATAAETGAHLGLAAVALRAPGAGICLLSALEYHDLTTQHPSDIWIAVSSRTRRPRLDGVRVHSFDARSFEVGLETADIDGVPVRVYSPARTVADCFKYRHKIGLDVALEALGQGLRDRRFTRDELWRMAGVCRVQRVITPYLEMAASV